MSYVIPNIIYCTEVFITLFTNRSDFGHDNIYCAFEGTENTVTSHFLQLRRRKECQDMEQRHEIEQCPEATAWRIQLSPG